MKKLILMFCIGGMLAFVACHREQSGNINNQQPYLNPAPAAAAPSVLK
jgi:hypothetical protein